MRKRIGLTVLCCLLIALVSTFFLVGCSGNSSDSNKGFDNYPNGGGADYIEDSDISEDGEDTPTLSERKIIYKVFTNFYSHDVGAFINKVKSNMEADEWYDSEVVRDNGYSTIVVRIKTARLDSFLNAISSGEKLTYIERTGTDISLSYQEAENKLNALKAEHSQLVTLMGSATKMDDIIKIRSRLTELELDIGNLEGTLNRYDSLVDYSTVTINVNKVNVEEAESFGNRISRVFKSAWKALGDFFKWLGVAIVAVFPFAIVILPIAAGITALVIILKKRKNRKIGNDKKEKPKDDDVNSI